VDAARALDSIPDEIIVVEPDCRIVAANRAFLTAGGAERENVLGRRCYEVRYARSEPCVSAGQVCPVRRVFETGRPASFRRRHRQSDGHMRWVDVLLWPVFDRHGRTTHAIECLREVAPLVALQEGNPYPVMSISSDGRLLYANQGSRPLLDEWGVEVGGIVPEAVHKKVREVMETGAIGEMELSCAGRDLLFALAPSKEYHRVHLYGLDVSERKWITELNGDLRRRIEYILGATKTGLDIIDGEFNLRYVDPERVRLYGDYSGRKCYEYFDGRDSPCPGCGLPEAMETKKTVVYERALPREDNRPVQVMTLPFRDATDDWLYAQVSVDLRARKRVEDELRTSREMYQSILDNIGIGIAMISPRMEILELNRKMREWFPHVDPTKAPVCYRAYNMPPRDGPCEYCPAVKTLADGQVHEATSETPTPDGVRNYRIISSPIRDAAGNVVAAIEMVEDVTERLAMERRLRQSHRMESIGRLAGGIAHDFNNILTGIGGYAELLLSEIGQGARAREDIQQIRELTARAATLTRQLLAFARRQALAPVVINLNALIENMMKMLKRIIPENISLEFLPASDLGNVRSDPSQMEQVVMNLVINARDAMPDGGRLTIETSNVTLDEDYPKTHVSARPGPHVLLAVSDTGSGMDEETLQHIFEPFFTTKERGRGTGIGLATVYGIVKQHGGNVWAYSEVGKGSVFKVYLPRVDADASPLKGKATGETPTGTEGILVVEDETAVCTLVERVLKGLGYDVFTASTPEEAEGVFRRQGERFRLLLTDVVLPGVGGEELSKRLRAHRPDLKVLFMSGYADNGVRRHGLLDSKVPYIQKPFSPDALGRKVREVLDG